MSSKTGTYLITGAGGFVGQALAAALINEDSISTCILADIQEPPRPKLKSTNVSVKCLSADLTSPEAIEAVFKPEITCIYLLHGIMSSQAEGDLELGLRVNIDSTRLILDHLRKTNPGVRVIFTSSTAVYGPPPEPGFLFSETTAADPQSSYGAQKHIAETLVNDYSRRGLLDGRVVRLPTVTVRPGKPTGAASSFASGIFREPLNGQKAMLPVSKDTSLWICSPRIVVKNLILASQIPEDLFKGRSRIVNLPGSTVSVQEMLDALDTVGGGKALALVQEGKDEKIQEIVKGWPTRLETSKAERLGFTNSGTLEQSLREYIEDYCA